MTEVQESRESGKAINSDEKTRQVTEVAINAGIDVVGIATSVTCRVFSSELIALIEPASTAHTGNVESEITVSHEMQEWI